MPAVLEWIHRVTDADLDELGHANNISYLKWMQAAALAHSAAQGWPAEAYSALGSGWVVRSHFIEYRAPALRDDLVTVRTWVSDMKKATSLRQFRMLTLREGVLLSLAEARTDWAFIDYATGIPRRIPAEILSSFVIVTDPDSATVH